MDKINKAVLNKAVFKEVVCKLAEEGLTEILKDRAMDALPPL